MGFIENVAKRKYCCCFFFIFFAIQALFHIENTLKYYLFTQYAVIWMQKGYLTYLDSMPLFLDEKSISENHGLAIVNLPVSFVPLLNKTKLTFMIGFPHIVSGPQTIYKKDVFFTFFMLG